MKDYSDIINLNYPFKTKKNPMPLYDRAAQFMPFAALTGYGDMVKETARLTSSKINLSDDEVTVINDKLVLLSSIIKDKPEVSVTYFKKDNSKAGGSYKIKNGIVKKIDLYLSLIIFTDKEKIALDDIIDINF